MSVTKTKEKVRDGYLCDLPEDLQSKVMNIHKLIKNTVNDLLNDSNYEDLKESKWAMSCIDEFCVMPKDKSEVGSVRVYKRGKTYRCMIQATGHFRNHQYGWIEELLHDFIGNVHTTVRPIIRRKYDMTITNEGRTGESHDGFDIFPNAKTAMVIWDKFDDRKTKTITETVFDNEMPDNIWTYYEYFHKMPYDDFCYEMSNGKLEYPENTVTNEDGENTPVGYSKNTFSFPWKKNQSEMLSHKIEPMTAATKNRNELPPELNQYMDAVVGIICQELLKISAEEIWKKFFSHGELEKILNDLKRDFHVSVDKKVIGNNVTYNSNIVVANVFFHGEAQASIDINATGDDPKTCWDEWCNFHTELMNRVMNNIPEKPKFVDSINNRGTNHIGNVIDVTPEYSEYLWLYIKSKQNPSVMKESTSPEYNVDMTEAQAKNTLRTLSQSIINDTQNKKDYKITQYTANIYANIITKNLLPLWAKGFRKFSIVLDSYQSFNTLEFKVPVMTQDFVSRFVNGRESINGFIHRNSEIKIKMSPRIFHTMKNAGDGFRFFKAAIKYYDSSLEKAGVKMMAEAMKLNHEMKHLVSTTKLSGIITYPLTLLFRFDNVEMNNVDTFRITQEDITTVNKFIKSIYARYASPEKERKKIIEDVQEMVKALRECSDLADENIRQLSYLPEAVEQYLFEGFASEIKKANDHWIPEQVDVNWNRNPKSYDVRYFQEKFGVKKLKKIPADLVPYIQIETESIRDANDKMMISSYCLGKIEIVEWYIELLEVGSKKYIVPHTKPYLETLRTQLLACFKKIMDTPIPKKDRPLIDIQYPKGYEG